MPGEVTQLLAEIRNGNKNAEARLASLVYERLHQMAAAYMSRERPGHTLQTTILVDEAYLQLVNRADRDWQNRSHFFAVAAQLMRRILIDYARTRNAAKRGGGRTKLTLDDIVVFSNDRCDELIDVDEALSRLAARDPRLGRVVELKFFAGMTDEEIGEVLGKSARQIKRDWSVAKAWLHGELASGKSDDDRTMGQD
jgi:RNA polymerase sigma-70 factor (ECF subfamily)